jgi:hypothetical protein
MTEKDLSTIRNSVAYVAKESKAMCTRRFIRIVTNDVDLDIRLSRLLSLFATDMPETTGGYAHHGH